MTLQFIQFLLLTSVLINNIILTNAHSTNHHGRTIFDIPQFEVDLILDNNNNNSNTFSSPSRQVEVSTKLKSATTAYLFDYIESIVDKYVDGASSSSSSSTESILEGIDLEVSLHADVGNNDTNNNNNNDGNRNRNLTKNEIRFVAEVVGSVTFSTTHIGSSYIMDQIKVEQMTYTAFLGMRANNDYLSKIQSILPNAISIDVKSDTRLTTPPGYGGKGGKGGRSGKSTAAIVLITFFILCTFILVSLWFYRERTFKRYGRRTRQGHLLMDIEQHSDYYDEDGVGGYGVGIGIGSGGGSASFPGFDSDGSIESYDTEPLQFIPVPARIDEVNNGRGGRTMTKSSSQQPQGVTPRRYVTPSSPFDLLYGAAFSHGDQAKVQSAKQSPSSGSGSGQQQPSSSSSSSSSPTMSLSSAVKLKIKRQKYRLAKLQQQKGKQLKPLNTITEVHEHENDDNGGTNMNNMNMNNMNMTESFFPQIMSSITSFISDKMDSSSSSSSSSSSTPKNNNKDEFLVYRDFPRHDGTPCVMFTPVGDVDWEKNQEDNKFPPQTAFPTTNNRLENDEDLSLASSDSSVYVNDVNVNDIGNVNANGNVNNMKKEKENIDCFVDKLEDLIAARSRQYEERKKMDREMLERKRIRLEQRQREKMVSTTTNTKVSTTISTADVSGTTIGQEKIVTDSITLEESKNILIEVDTPVEGNTDIGNDSGTGTGTGTDDILLSAPTPITTEGGAEGDLLSLHVKTLERNEDGNSYLNHNTTTSPAETNNNFLLSTTTTTTTTTTAHVEETNENQDDILSLNLVSGKKDDCENLNVNNSATNSVQASNETLLPLTVVSEQSSQVDKSSSENIIHHSNIDTVASQSRASEDETDNSPALFDEKQHLSTTKVQNDRVSILTDHNLSENAEISPRDVETTHFEDEHSSQKPESQEISSAVHNSSNVVVEK